MIKVWMMADKRTASCQIIILYPKKLHIQVARAITKGQVQSKPKEISPQTSNGFLARITHSKLTGQIHDSPRDLQKSKWPQLLPFLPVTSSVSTMVNTGRKGIDPGSDFQSGR